jgi:hypothetical protein
MKQTASSAGVLLGLLFNNKDGGYMFLRNMTLTGVYNVLSQKTVLFMCPVASGLSETELTTL